MKSYHDDRPSRHARLPFRPAPQPGEIFVSWLARLAAANKTDVGTMLIAGRNWIGGSGLPYPNSTFPRYPLNVERDTILTIVREVTGVPHAKLAPMLLNRRGNLRTTWSMYTPSGLVRFPAGMAAAQQSEAWLPDAFCPQCLAEGFYLRRIWRVGFLALCLVHGCPLIEFCPRCGDGLDFYVQVEQGRSLMRADGALPCLQCRYDLTQIKQTSWKMSGGTGFVKFCRFMLAALENRLDGIVSAGCTSISLSVVKLLTLIDVSDAGKRIREPERPVDAIRRLARNRTPYVSRPCGERLKLLQLAYRAIESRVGKRAHLEPGIAACWDQLTPRAVAVLERVSQKLLPSFDQARAKNPKK